MELFAIVMCGGRGKRLGFVEKPMLEIGGKRLIEYIVKEVELANLQPIFVTSPFAEKTERFLKEIGKEVLRAEGKGYMEDLIYAIKSYNLFEPMFNLNSDLYIAKSGIISEFVCFYLRSDFPAASMVYKSGRRVGINAFDPMLDEQREEKFIIGEKDIINIDTPRDLERVKNGRIF